MSFLNRIPVRVLALVLLALSLGVRLLNITTTDIAGDEPFSIFTAQFNIPFIIEYLSSGNNPPLFEILLHYYMMWFGDSDLILRLFPTIFSALTVIPILLIGEHFFNRKVAITASILFVFSIFHIRFAHEIRVYSLFSFTTAWALYSFLSVIKKPAELKWWGILAICNVILLYSHFTSFYIILLEGVCCLVFIPRNYWKHLFATVVVTSICYTPYLVVFIERLGDVSTGGTWVEKPGWGELYGSINLMLNNRITTALTVLILVVGMVISSKKNTLDKLKSIISNQIGMTVLLWFILPYTLMFFISMFYIPMFIDRYILYTSIPLFLSVAWIVDQMWSQVHFHWLGGFLLVGISIFTTDVNPGNNRHIKLAVEHVKELNNDDTHVYICPDFFDLTFAYHYNKKWFRMTNSSFPKRPRGKVDSIMKLNGIFPIREADQLKMENAQRVIYLDAASDFVLPENGIFDKLKSQMVLVDSTHFHQIFDVYLFTKKP